MRGTIRKANRVKVRLDQKPTPKNRFWNSTSESRRLMKIHVADLFADGVRQAAGFKSTFGERSVKHSVRSSRSNA